MDLEQLILQYEKDFFAMIFPARFRIWRNALTAIFRKLDLRDRKSAGRKLLNSSE